MNPPVRPLDPGLLHEYRNAHDSLERALVAAGSPLDHVMTRYARRLTIDSLVDLAPIVSGVSEQPLFPSPRAFLSTSDRDRRKGAAGAIRYIIERLTRERSTEEPSALLPESPHVLHALLEGPLGDAAAGPGVVRSGSDRSSEPPMRDADAAGPRSRLIDAVAEATSGSEPVLERATKLALATHLIYPFPSANWQVAILLYMLVGGQDLPRLADWGIAEQFALHRATNHGDLLRALGDGSRDADRLDPMLFQGMLTELSTVGAQLGRRRLEAAGSLVDELRRRFDIKPESAIVVLAVFLRRFARPEEIADDLGWPDRSATVILGNLAHESVLKRKPPPPSRRGGTDGSAYQIDYAVQAVIDGHIGRLAAPLFRC